MPDWMQKLFNPPRFPADEDKTRVARLLNTVLLALMLIFIINTVVAILFNPDITAVTINAATIFINLGLLALLRRGHVHTASLVTLTVFWLIVSAVAFWLTGLSLIIVTSYFVLVVLAGLIAGVTASTAFMLLTLLMGSLILFLQITNRYVPSLPGPLLVNGTASAGNLIALTLILNLTLITLNRTLRTLHQRHEQLHQTQAMLETRVAERTRDLILAAEVGRNITQVRDLNTLLIEAVERIRERFDLYYVQIYLADNRQQLLNLHAGTGQVGELLVQRGHQLRIGPGSINGLAAAGRQIVIVSDTKDSPFFRANPLLPRTRAEMAVPLIVGHQVLGVLNLQSEHPNAWSNESRPAFETLGSQLAVSITNARLLAETETARQELEMQTRRLTQMGWDAFLNATTHAENIGFTYDAGTLHPLMMPLPGIQASDQAIQADIMVGNEPIGLIQVEADMGYRWPEETLTLVHSVAQQVGQRVENLRLLAQAEQYRQEAETAIRHMTHENWQEYIAQKSGTMGFIYDGRIVLPLTPNDTPTESATMQHPIQVQGETIGYLEITGADWTDVTTDMITAVSDRLGSHLENLRLTVQTEQALAQTAQRANELLALNEIAQSIARQLDLTTLLDTIRAQVQHILPADAFIVGLYDAPTNLMHYPIIYDAGQHYPPSTNTPSDTNSLLQAIRTGQPVLLNRTPAQVAEITEKARRNATQTLGNESKISASLLYVPIQTGGQTLGAISTQSYQFNAYDMSSVSLLRGVSDHLATALQNVRLFEQVQQSLTRTEMLFQFGRTLLILEYLPEVLETAVNSIATAVHAWRTLLIVCDIDRKLITHIRHGGDAAPTTDQEVTFDQLWEGLSGWALRQRLPALSSKEADDPRESAAAHQYRQDSGLGSVLVTPMIYQNKVLGTITALNRSDQPDFTAADAELMMAMTAQASAAINNRILSDAIQARARQEQVLREITARIYAAPNAETILRTAAAEVNLALGLETFVYIGETARQETGTPPQNGHTPGHTD